MVILSRDYMMLHNTSVFYDINNTKLRETPYA